MKVLIVNSYDLVGGAARAAYRLHKALLSKGHDSQMLVLSKSSDDFSVIEPESKLNKYIPKLRVILDSLPVRFYKERKKNLFSPSYLPFSHIVEQINAINPEVVHLHWIADGMMRIEDIAKINAPIIWTLHDDWGYTGGCHVKWDCEKYQTQCDKCPQLGSKRENDLSHKIFERKKRTYSAIKNLSIVAVSHWLSECVRESNLLSTRKITTIPNPLDTKEFSPIIKQDARRILNLPPDKKLILFGANSATSDINKGFHKLSFALSKVDCDAELVVFGSGEPMESQGFKQKAHYLGHLHDNVSLRLLYSAADVMVVPSLQESFGQTASESMACGTPVVAFAATGLLDIVDHLHNGYLAKPFDPEDLAAGINMVLNANNYEELSYNASLKVRSQFDSELIADKYIALYQQSVPIK